MSSPNCFIGKRLLPKVLDDIASFEPNRLYGSIARTADLNDGFRDITFHDMANGVNGFAHYLKDTVGQSKKFDTIGYIGVSDFRTAIVFLAAVKCGYKVGSESLVWPRHHVDACSSFFPHHGTRSRPTYRCLSKRDAGSSSTPPSLRRLPKVFKLTKTTLTVLRCLHSKTW